MPGSAPAMIGPLFDTAERAQLSDLLDELGPGAPTLLAPWTARDIAAHLVLRERDYLGGPGLSCPVRGAAWPDGEQERSLKRTSHRWLPRSGQDRRQASSASDGCAGSPA